jgi:hypothetical protein
VTGSQQLSSCMDLTVQALWGFLYGKPLHSPPEWPPDIFALCIATLQRSGAYIRVVQRWPPVGSAKGWTETTKRIGKEWRVAVTNGSPPPSDIARWWSLVVNSGLRISEVRQNEAVCDALLQLAAVADECCVNVGLPSPVKEDAFEAVANGVLRSNDGATLTKDVHASRCRVLPKMHTPQKGITIRSLSHNLALCPAGDLRLSWELVPSAPASHSINLLLLPWPLAIAPRQFQATESVRGNLLNMAEGHGFFHYETTPLDPLIADLDHVIERAEELMGRIDGVICPELSMAADEHRRVRDAVLAKSAFLLAGVTSSDGSGFDRNYLLFDLPLSKKHFTSIEQPKHHRWCLDKGQILQYGIGGSLDPSVRWWEHTAVEDRRLTFVAMRPWLTTCVLICEDLARQDPISEVVRAVGPNLVIALLMDGPQLRSRWSARYATVLADDPGSSVLTLTSLGMAIMSRPGGRNPSRVVALWKDAATSEAREIELAANSIGVVLSLSVEYLNEWTADGRDDDYATGYPLLAGVHEIPKI